MRRLCAAIGSVAVLIAGCGASPSPAAYRAKLAKLCAGEIAFDRSLPQRARDQKLSFAALRKLTDARSEQFRAAIDAVAVPDRLKSAAAQLHDALHAPPPESGKAAQIAYIRRIAAAWKAVGAEDCAATIDREVTVIK